MIAAWRHPVIEKLLEQRGERFVPNDLYFGEESPFLLLITGPNMGGKSTYLRQAALISILAQMGSFVPVAQAKLPLLDRIFTRIGASDNLARGAVNIFSGNERGGRNFEHGNFVELSAAG